MKYLKLLGVIIAGGLLSIAVDRVTGTADVLHKMSGTMRLTHEFTLVMWGAALWHYVKKTG